jgi:uncharacterized protein (TIRG00374 family)
MLKLALRTLVSLAMSALFVWLSLRHTDVRAVAAAMGAADPVRILLYIGLMGVIHLVRTVRWGILLEPLGHVGFKRLNSASAVGFMLLMLLPLRLGEFARPLLIAQPPPGGGVRLRRSGALASCVVERIVDGIAIGLLGMVSLRMLGSSASGSYVEFARKASVLVALGFFGLSLTVVAALVFRERALRLTHALLAPLSPRFASKATSIVEGFIDALHLGSGFKLVGFFALTAFYWCLSGVGLAVLAPAFGFTGLTPLMIAVILTIQVVGVMVPAGPGMVGTMQFFTQAGLSLFVADGFSARAAGYANTIWLLQFGFQVALGLTFLLIGHVSLKGVLGAAPADDDGAAAAAP